MRPSRSYAGAAPVTRASGKMTRTTSPPPLREKQPRRTSPSADSSPRKGQTAPSTRYVPRAMGPDPSQRNSPVSPGNGIRTETASWPRRGAPPTPAKRCGGCARRDTLTKTPWPTEARAWSTSTAPAHAEAGARSEGTKLHTPSSLRRCERPWWSSLATRRRRQTCGTPSDSSASAGTTLQVLCAVTSAPAPLRARPRRTACATERLSTRTARVRYYAPHVTIPAPSPADLDAAKALALREGRPAKTCTAPG